MLLHKILKYIALIAGVVGLFFLGWSISAGGEALSSQAELQSQIIDPYLYLAYIVLLITIVLVLIFAVRSLIKGNVVKTLISLGVFALILIIGYFSAGDAIPMAFRNNPEVTHDTAHWVSSGLIVFYILAGLAVLTLIASEIRKAIK